MAPPATWPLWKRINRSVVRTQSTQVGVGTRFQPAPKVPTSFAVLYNAAVGKVPTTGQPACLTVHANPADLHQLEGGLLCVGSHTA